MRRKLSLLAALCLALMLCAACSDEAAAPPGAEVPVETIDPHEGEVLVSDGMGGTMWVKDYENLPRNEYDTACLGRDGEYITYESGEHTAMRGIDVSFYQGEIDWQAVADDGVGFAVIRAGYRGSTEGKLNTDERFEENLTGAVSAGLRVGVYFFSQAITEEEAREEARYVLELLDGRPLDLPVFFDWEHVSSDEGARTDTLGGAALTDCCLAFCGEIMNAGYEAGVYYYRSLAYRVYELDRLEGLVKWMACAGSTPDYYYDFDIWQYSFTGTVAGIEADTDLNLWFIPRDTLSEPVSGTGHDGCAETAGLYEDRLAALGVENYAWINLTDDQLRGIVGVLAENGLCAIDVAQSLVLSQPDMVAAFAESYSLGEAAVLDIYEVCYDGGFIRHRLERSGSGASVTLTRVAWEEKAPVVTYSVRYPITKLEITDSTLYYEYYMADNPEGGNHDGHIDTETGFRLS